MSCRFERTTSCTGCAAIEVAAALSRIDTVSIRQSRKKIQSLCPDGLSPEKLALKKEIAKQIKEKKDFFFTSPRGVSLGE